MFPASDVASDAADRIRDILLRNVVPFWYPGAVDSEHGGYRLNHDPNGRYLGDDHKYAISQARMLWFFSRLARTPYGSAEHLKAARAGFDFLERSMRDPIDGGYFWEVGPQGDLTTRSRRTRREGSVEFKSVLAQSYVLHALAEYATASREPLATARALELFGLLDAHARDRTQGGWREFFTRDWRTASDRYSSFHGGYAPSSKTFGPHLHLLEALTSLVGPENDPAIRDALAEAARSCERLVLKPIGVVSNVNAEDWRPVFRHPRSVHEYGHDLELIWLLHRAWDALGLRDEGASPLLRPVFANAVSRGWDIEQGGFFTAGEIGGRPLNRTKVWWVQAEALVCSLELHRRTGEGVFARCFNDTLDWVVEHQVDWEHGEWHAEIRPDGSRAGRKADAWKAAYHDGRALIECLEMLGGDTPP
jgi:mannobiose 2-epimerase